MSQSDCSKDGPPEIPHRPSTETEIGHKCPEEEQMRKLLELCLCVFSKCVWSHGFYFKICDTDRFWYLPFPWLHHYMLIVYIYIYHWLSWETNVDVGVAFSFLRYLSGNTLSSHPPTSRICFVVKHKWTLFSHPPILVETQGNSGFPPTRSSRISLCFWRNAQANSVFPPCAEMQNAS